MSGLSTFSIGGLASGLDTNNILSQLMKLERVPITQMQSRQAVARKRDEAWATIVSKLSALRTAIDNVGRKSTWDTFAAVTTSDSAVVDTRVTGSPVDGAVSLRVVNLAYAAQRASADTFSGLGDTMGGRDLILHTAEGDFTINSDADTTLEDFVALVNGSGAPVRAQAIEETSGVFKLVLSSTATGTDNDFTLTETGWTNPFVSTQAAANAQIRVGDPVNGLLVERQSNTVDDLVEGVTLTLKNTSATAVTITTSRDADKAVARVKKLVDEANSLLKAAADLTKYDAEDRKGQPLAGDSTVRSLVSTVTTIVSGLITGVTGDYGVASSVGIETTRDGLLTLDDAKLREALAEDFDAVAKLFGRTGAPTDSRVRFVLSTDDTVPGTYAVQITQAARTPQVTGSVYAASAQNLTITSDGVTAVVAADGTESLAQLITKINDELAAEGITTLRAELDTTGTKVQLTDSRYGSAASFTVSSDGDGYGLAGATPATGQTYTGADVAGTVNGVAGTGKGQTLTIDSDGDEVDGLVLRITATQAEVTAAGGTLALGNLAYTRGVAGELSAALAQFEGSDGHIQTTRDRLSDEIAMFDERIARMEVRLTQREQTLMRQFTALETAMSRLQSQSSWLASQLANLGGGDR